MCGLVGMAGNIVESDKKALKALFRMDMWRGEDSTGLAIVTAEKGEIILRKKVGTPDAGLFQEDIFDDKSIYIGARAKVFIGHNRAATKGSITDANAHPFYQDGIVGAHNGTLKGAGELDDFDKFEVDSEAIFYNLAKYETKDVINSIYGAYALVWYDDATDTVNVIRNSERPLVYTRRLDSDVIFWASTKDILEISLAIAGIKHGPIKEFEVNKLYTLDVSDTTPAKFRTIDWEVQTERWYGYFPPAPKYNNSSWPQGGNKSNVIPFVSYTPTGSASSSSFSKEEIQEMKFLGNKEIEFRFASVKDGASKSRYIACYPTDINKDWDIRIYGEKNKNWPKWLQRMHNTTYTGTVKRVVDHFYKGKRQVYLLIDLRSLKEVSTTVTPAQDKINAKKDEPTTVSRAELIDSIVDQINKSNLFTSDKKGDDENDYYEGFLGRYLSKSEFEECTKRGCASCTADASPNDCDLIFIDHDAFLCGACSDMYPNFARN